MKSTRDDNDRQRVEHQPPDRQTPRDAQRADREQMRTQRAVKR